MELLTTVQATTYDISPPSSRLPPAVWTGFVAINKVHAAWRWYRRYEVYSNPNNLAQLLAGHTVNFIAGDAMLVRIAFQCLLISTRILEAVRQQNALLEAGRSCKDAVLGRYPKPVPCSWQRRHNTAWEEFRNRIQRIALNTIALLVQIFRSSMTIMDAVDALSLNPHTRHEAVNEGFVNAMKCMDTLVDNRQELLQGLVNHRRVIERLLQGSPLTYDQVYDGVAKTLEKTEAIHTKSKQISSIGNGIIIQASKQALSEIMVVFGMARLRPTWLARENYKLPQSPQRTQRGV